MFRFATDLVDRVKNTLASKISSSETSISPVDEQEGDWTLVPPKHPDLTFGIEIEFALATLQPSAKDPKPLDNRRYVYCAGQGPNGVEWTWKNVYAHISNTLTDAGIPATVLHPTYEELPRDKNKWKVAIDESIGVKNNSTTPYTWWAVEVISPVLVFNADNLRLVRRVCETLERRYRIETNDSTGLHVHVGNYDRGFKFDVMRRLVGLLWTFDHQISSIHSEHRRERSVHCASFRERSHLAEEIFEAQGKNRAGSCGLTVIFEMLQETDLFVECMKPARDVDTQSSRGSYFIGNVELSQRSIGSNQLKPTVEFRQHGSTIEPARVIHWISLCVRLVDFACRTDEKELLQFLRQHIEKSVQEFPLGAVLRAFDMIEEAEFYEQQIPIDEASREKEKARRKVLGLLEDEVLHPLH